MELEKLNLITEKIIGCAINVHRILGPGLLEKIYENALCVEFELNNIKFERQLIVPVMYKNRKIGEHRLDILVENEIVVELKAINEIHPIFEAQILSYLKMSGKKIGLIINFNNLLLKDGSKRIIVSGN